MPAQLQHLQSIQEHKQPQHSRAYALSLSSQFKSAKMTTFTMARKWSNLNIPGALHFITGNVRDRIPVFKHELYCHEFFAVLGELRTNWPAKLIAYVLMPDHFHLVTNPKDGRIKEFTGALKGQLATRIIERFILPKPAATHIHQVWQESFKATPLWSAWMIWQKD